MKHIGIAAVTAEGALLVYREICKIGANMLGEHRHPEISLHSFSFSEHVHVGADYKEKWAELISASAAKLHRAGADFLICPANTPHEIYNRVSRDLPFSWLHIAGAVREMAERAELEKLLLLGTQYTIDSSMYDEQFYGSNITLIRPDSGEVKRTHEIITRELVKGRATDSARAFFKHMLEKYSARGVDGVILGCTELPLAIDENVSCVPVLDSTKALADAAVHYAVTHDAVTQERTWEVT